VDAETADLLEKQASMLGMSVSDQLAELAHERSILPSDLAEMHAKGEGPWSAEALEEDARCLADFEQSRMAVPWDKVKAWMESWGRPDEA
jgi:hypothetical protein